MDIKTKLTSRKLWAAIAGVVVGLVVAFGGEAETVETVAGTVMSVVSAIVYIIAEATVDKASAAAPMYAFSAYIDAEREAEEDIDDTDEEYSETDDTEAEAEEGAVGNDPESY